MLLFVCLLLSLLTHIHAFCPSFLSNQTACSCFAYIDGIVIKCNGPMGPGVVEQLKKHPLDIRELALENANIVEIGRHAFRNLRIKKLVLDNNRIRALHPDAFRGLESVMQELSISMNKLTAVPTDALIAMRALSVLSLRCNQITDIESPVFRNLSSLIDLNLGCNQICNITGPVFHDVRRTLQNLILDNNCLTAIPSDAIRNMDNLIGLHLKYNQIEQMEKMQLMNMSSLTILTLTGNKISMIQRNIVSNNGSLKYLYLGSNDIKFLDPSVLLQFTQLQVLDLSYNQLTEITEDMFSGLEHLQHLNLDGNHIKAIAAGSFATTPLLLLWLPNNCLDSVTPNMFQGAPFLRQVSLANNNIHTVQPLSFAHLANLHTLDLSHNKIKVLQPGAITGSDHLTVRLQENPMVCSQDGFHVMNGREAINLTTEPNDVCKTDYTKDTKDVCPRNAEPPLPPTCCNRAPAPRQKMTTEAPLTTTDEQVEALPATEIKAIGEDKTESEPEESESTTESEPSTESESTTPMTKSEQDAVAKMSSRGRKLNLERFFRLSRRPNEAMSSPFLRHRLPQGTNPANTQILRIEPPNKHRNKSDRPVPSRVEERQRQLALSRSQLPSWIRTNAKDKGEQVEFNTDSRVVSVRSRQDTSTSS